MFLIWVFYFFLGYAALHLLALVLELVVGLLDIFICVSGIEERDWKRRHKTAMVMRAEREAELTRRWEAAKAAQAAQQHPPA